MLTPPLKGSLRDELLQDWAANKDGFKSRFTMVSFRAAHRLHRDGKPSLVGKLGIGVYKFVSNWILGVEIPPGTKIGPACRIRHPQAIVVNGSALIGANCTIRSCVTIGNVVRGNTRESPIIEDHVEIGASVVVIGGIRIGEGAKLGAGAIVVKDVPPGAVAVSPAAQIIKTASAPENAAAQDVP